jgi:hypothetical protein
MHCSEPPCTLGPFLFLQLRRLLALRGRIEKLRDASVVDVNALAPDGLYDATNEDGESVERPRAADLAKELQEEIDASLLNVLGWKAEDFDDLEANGKPEDMLYLIKWTGISHLHNTWHTLEELEEMEKNGEIKGVRKVHNFQRLADERDAVLDNPNASSEHKEVINCEVRSPYSSCCFSPFSLLFCFRSVASPA